MIGEDAGTCAEGNITQTTTVTREQIENLIRRIFEIENARPTKTVEETIAGIDSLMASTVEGWTNGKHCPNRNVEREFERGLFGALQDYHRNIERVIIELPFASSLGRKDLQKQPCLSLSENAV